MSDWQGRYPPRSTPRPVDGGIQARTARGAIGESWWSKRFLDVLESLAIASRLTRGRSYARKGQVLSLEVAAGRVTARVQGSRAQPYQVRIGLAGFPEPVWERVEAALARQAIHSARLLAGEMPPGIEEVFTAAGAPLFPQRRAELTMSCSCPDQAVPCKHLAATFYLLAEAFDTDPFQILRWRGRARDRLLARLRTLRDAGAVEEPADRGAAGEPAVGAALALAELTSSPLTDSLERFWLPPVPLPDRPATMDTEPDLLLRQLREPGSALGGPALVDRLRPAYQRFGESAHSAMIRPEPPSG